MSYQPTTEEQEAFRPCSRGCGEALGYCFRQCLTLCQTHSHWHCHQLCTLLTQRYSLTYLRQILQSRVLKRARAKPVDNSRLAYKWKIRFRSQRHQMSCLTSY